MLAGRMKKASWYSGRARVPVLTVPTSCGCLWTSHFSLSSQVRCICVCIHVCLYCCCLLSSEMFYMDSPFHPFSTSLMPRPHNMVPPEWLQKQIWTWSWISRLDIGDLQPRLGEHTRLNCCSQVCDLCLTQVPWKFTYLVCLCLNTVCLVPNFSLLQTECSDLFSQRCCEGKTTSSHGTLLFRETDPPGLSLLSLSVMKAHMRARVGGGGGMGPSKWY